MKELRLNRLRKFDQFIIIFLTFHHGNDTKEEEATAFIIVGGYVSYLDLVGVMTIDNCSTSDGLSLSTAFHRILTVDC